MNNKIVKVAFKNGKTKRFRNVSVAHTDVNYSMFEFEHKNKATTYLLRNDIQYIKFGKDVEVEVH
ncbi:TPA: hypothetical protein I1774_000627 [Staphylococcus pseudintermedius]|nr:hypothetical protein [Staphylococcus pseudintermedius]